MVKAGKDVGFRLDFKLQAPADGMNPSPPLIESHEALAHPDELAGRIDFSGELLVYCADGIFLKRQWPEVGLSIAIHDAVKTVRPVRLGGKAMVYFWDEPSALFVSPGASPGTVSVAVGSLSRAEVYHRPITLEAATWCSECIGIGERYRECVRSLHPARGYPGWQMHLEHLEASIRSAKRAEVDVAKWAAIARRRRFGTAKGIDQASAKGVVRENDRG